MHKDVKQTISASRQRICCFVQYPFQLGLNYPWAPELAQSNDHAGKAKAGNQRISERKD